jgi:hypothetical protein
MVAGAPKITCTEKPGDRFRAHCPASERLGYLASVLNIGCPVTNKRTADNAPQAILRLAPDYAGAVI